MAYRLIKGQFHLSYKRQRHVGSQPDGDSIWFKPNQVNLLSNLSGRNADFNGGGFVNLRFEGIDALELHYKGSHQSLNNAKASRDLALSRAGFQQVIYSTASQLGLSVKNASPHPVLGYILTRGIDPFGRPVSFVFAGSASEQDGSNVWLGVSRLNQSINAKLIDQGQAYPAFYTGLPSDLRDRITELTIRAWEYDRGLRKT